MMKKPSSIKIISALLLSVFLCFALCQCMLPVTENPATEPPQNDTSKPFTEITTESEADRTEEARTETQIPESTETGTEEIPAVETVRRVSFLAAGDNMIYYGNVREAMANAKGGAKYDFSSTYALVKDFISSYDIAFINQETLLSSAYAPSYYPLFCGPVEMGDALVDAGFDVVNIATNHMIDMDAYTKDGAGLLSSIEFWQNKDVLLIGGYKDKADLENIRIYEENGIKIAFLSYTYGTNGLSLSKSASVVIPYLEKELVTSQIEKAREIADIVIVSSHWGDEYSFKPNESQKSYAKLMADSGADVIIGHHPHVLQPVEWIEGKNGNKTLCVYSLGNFVSEMSEPSNMAGGMITFDIVKNGGAKPEIENVRFTPTVYSFNSSFYENKVIFMEDYTEAMAASHGISYYNKKLTAAQLRGFVKNVIDSSFLPDFLKQ